MKTVPRKAVGAQQFLNSLVVQRVAVRQLGVREAAAAKEAGVVKGARVVRAVEVRPMHLLLPQCIHPWYAVFSYGHPPKLKFYECTHTRTHNLRARRLQPKRQLLMIY